MLISIIWKYIQYKLENLQETDIFPYPFNLTKLNQRIHNFNRSLMPIDIKSVIKIEQSPVLWIHC